MPKDAFMFLFNSISILGGIGLLLLVPRGLDCLVLRRPFLIWAIMGGLAFVDFLYLQTGPAFSPEFSSDDWVRLWGFHGDWTRPWQLWTHVLCPRSLRETVACLLMLHYFGPALEDRLGKIRFLAFFLVGCSIGPLLFPLVRNIGSIPMTTPACGFPIPLAFLLGLFLVLHPWSSLRGRYVLLDFRTGFNNGTIEIPSFFVVAVYLLVQNGAVLLDQEVRAGLSVDAFLQVLNVLLGFVVGGCLFGFEKVLKGGMAGRLEEGRLRRSLQRAVRDVPQGKNRSTHSVQRNDP
jgi:membrane associated rhomboid family serine protease